VELGYITAALALGHRAWKWWNGRKRDTVATRFVRLMESHGVHRNQIPRFIGHDLTLKDVQNDAALLAKLDEALLDAVCAQFAVRREWLDGAEPQIHLVHDFYQQPQEFAAFLENLISGHPTGDVTGMVLAPAEEHTDAESLIIFEEPIGTVGDKPIYRYHLVAGGPFSYWKSRAYLTAGVASAWKRGVYVQGRKVPGEEITRLTLGKTLLGWHGEGIWGIRGDRWDPEDMTLRPDAFLAGIDPERDDFGIQSALRLWLDLDRQGLMGTGISGVNAIDTRQLFEQVLNSRVAFTAR
jgi:hypothetical protein